MVDINQGSFYNLLQNNPLLESVDIKQVNSLLEKYPAFHSLYILKALALKNESEERFEQNLPYIATNVLDRTQLYDILFNPLEVLTLQEEQGIKDAEKDAKNNDFVVEDKVIEEIPQEEEILIEENELNENLSKDADFQDEKNEDSSLEGKTENRDETQVEIEEKELINEDIQSESKEIDSSPISPSSNVKPLSFVEWLKLKNENSISSTSPKKGIESKESILTPSKSKDEKIPFEQVSEIEAELIKSSASQSQSHLDSFINSQIAKKKNKKKFSSQKVENEDSNPELISETLAEILFLQKKYDDAIHVYEKLSLKYPQKSSYFASRIKKIKKII